MNHPQLRTPNKTLLIRVFDHIQKMPATYGDFYHDGIDETAMSVWSQGQWMAPIRLHNLFSKELAEGRFRILDNYNYKMMDRDGSGVRVLAVETHIGSVDCGSAACFAGWTVLLTDNGRYQPIIDQVYRVLPDCRIHVTDTKFRSGVVWDSEKEEITTIGEVATELLGLDYLRSTRLFEADNTLKEIGKIVEAISEDCSDEWFESYDGDYAGDH